MVSKNVCDLWSTNKSADFFRKGSSKSYKLLERLSEPLAELQCCSLQGHSVKQWVKQWLVLRTTGFVLGERMFGETFLLPITDLGNDVSVPFVLKVPCLKLTVSVPLKNGLGNNLFWGPKGLFLEALLGLFSRLFQARWLGKNLAKSVIDLSRCFECPKN